MLILHIEEPGGLPLRSAICPQLVEDDAPGHNGEQEEDQQDHSRGASDEDHFVARFAYRCTRPITLNDYAKNLPGRLRMALRYAMFRSGPMASNGNFANTFVRSLSLAWWITPDSVTVLRLAIVPNPMAMLAVSARETTTSSGLTDQASATIWAKMVSMPWPCGQAPPERWTLPEGSIRTVAPSKGPMPVPSV